VGGDGFLAGFSGRERGFAPFSSVFECAPERGNSLQNPWGCLAQRVLRFALEFSPASSIPDPTAFFGTDPEEEGAMAL